MVYDLRFDLAPKSILSVSMSSFLVAESNDFTIKISLPTLVTRINYINLDFFLIFRSNAIVLCVYLLMKSMELTSMHIKI